MSHKNQVEKGKDMGIIKKYKWYILPLAILVIVVAIVTMKPSKKTKKVKIKPTTVTKVSKHSTSSSSKEAPSETSQTQEQPTQSEQAPSETSQTQEQPTQIEQTPSETSQTQEQSTQIEQAPSTQADGITPPQDTLKQAQEQYGYIPGYGGIPADSPEVAREQAENEARQRWHDGQVEWGIQQGYLNPDGSPKETN
ncbi:hypothetical protein PIG80_07460 [Streptococcus thermophilus]|uniref:hypothetical protein n=1 Tax=Streptococcus thermophilus TaxID=1308 RepID=UPI0022FF3FA2|nr:hypothetical protein [Streptococcus thermophilus]MDA5554893.1 hypothetical protein [Streptococcus thermophilus]